MILFGPSAKELVRKRAPVIEHLAKMLNAEYFDSVYRVMGQFSIPDNRDMTDCNVISGNIDGYDYCFIEYFHEKRTKNDHSHWVSKVFLRMKYEGFPDFELDTKFGVFFNTAVILIFLIAISIVPAFIFLPSFFSMFPIFRFHGFMGFLSGLFFILVIIGILYFVGKFFFKSFFKAFDQKKYGILNKKFNEEYVIISDAPVNEIRKVFTEQLCARIVKQRGTLCIKVKNNCVSGEFKDNQQLSFELCNSHLNNLLKAVKIFENE